MKSRIDPSRTAGKRRHVLAALLMFGAAASAQPSPRPLPPVAASPVLEPLPELPPPLPLPAERVPAPNAPRPPAELPGPERLPATERPPSERARPPAPAPGVVHRVRLQVTGNRRFNDKELRAAIAEQLSAIEQSGLTPALADDAAFFLGVFYRKNGFSQAQIQASIAAGSTLRLSINEGPATKLGRVVFEGNRRLPDATLRNTLTGSIKENLPKTETALPYVENGIDAGVDRIRGLYRAEGYLDATAGPARVTFSRDKTRADLTVPIHEGVQYRFGKLSFEGDIVFFPQRELLRELEVFTNRPYTPLAVTNLERKVVYFYRTRGYFNARVRSESSPATAPSGVVPVKFIVEAGDIYRFDGVSQTGLRKLRPGFLPARFSKLRGQLYSPAKLEARYRSLMGTGLFSNLKLTQIPHPNHEVELHFDVEEAKSRELGFSIGYASLEGALLGARYLDRDILGFGRPLSFDIEIAQRLLRGQVVYTDPWFLNSDFTMRLRLYELSQDLIDYSKVETGFRAELSRKFGQHWEITAFALTRRVDISNTGGIAATDIGLQHYLADSIGVSATLDYRDSILNPTKGLIINASTDMALNVFGSSLDFLRGTFRISYYLPLGKTLLAIGARGGVLYPLERMSQIPIDERFFNGGSGSVRSYVERSLGPRDRAGHAVGGETFTNANIEDVFPLFGNLKGAVFFDAGSVGRYLASGIGETGYAVGPGLRYQLPIGPIRLDYGFNPFRRSNQPFGALHFSFGFAF